MLVRSLLAFALTAGLAVSAAAGPKPDKPEKECPPGGFDEVVEPMIEKAASCGEAMELAVACALGAAADVQLGAAVQDRCERDFLSKLNKTQRRAYNAEHRRCERKYIRESGTMYRSAEAFCHAEVAEKYSRRFTKKPPRN
jgi:hypothetical protein